MPPRWACATRQSATILCGIVVLAQAVRSADVERDRIGSDTTATPITVDQVLAVWSQRATGLRSFRATWVHERTYTKLWAHCHVPSARDEYVTLRFGESALTLDGDRLRFETIDSQGWLVHDDARSACSGTVASATTAAGHMPICANL